MAKGLSPALPLSINEIDGPYRLNKTLNQVISQNLKMLVLTNPGERIMDPEFGVGISRYLFEQVGTDVMSNLRNRIFSQAETYLPYITIQEVNSSVFNGNSNSMRVIITYVVSSIGEEHVLDLIVEQ